MRILKSKPDFKFEKEIWKKGFDFVAGLDEVGRGSFAGPVVAGLVLYESEIKDTKEVNINDSKKLTQKQRRESEGWIKENALLYSVGEVNAGIINSVGMGKATHMAFRKAVKKANGAIKEGIEFILVDAFFVPHVRGFPTKRNVRQKAIKKGDSLSFSIASASIIAKEYRDSLMKKLAKKNPFDKYLWDKNKGYGTKEHRDAIKKHGITKQHRVRFVESYI
jgi:ribonuclease HII